MNAIRRTLEYVRTQEEREINSALDGIAFAIRAGMVLTMFATLAIELVAFGVATGLIK